MKKAAKKKAAPRKRAKKKAAKSVKAQWKHTPPLADQLQRCVEALSDIAELAEQIGDPEVFRRHAHKIAKRSAVIAGSISVSWEGEDYDLAKLKEGGEAGGNRYKPCPRCAGRGQLRNLHSTVGPRTCPDCHGSGLTAREGGAQ